jgi:ATPase family associated with various cellular activities (AAA)
MDCSASDLIGQYVGHTGPKTRDKLTEALGRVLFVDEAYRFCDGGFGKEAVNELVDCLTRPKFMGKIVVILAGYTKNMEKLLRMNPGLASRLPKEIIFSNMAAQECSRLLEQEIRKPEIHVVPAIKDTAPAQYQSMENMLTKLSKLPSWGNGCDVKHLANSTCSVAFANSAPSSPTLAVGAVHVLRELEAMLKAQTVRCVDVRWSPNSIPRRSSLPSRVRTRDPPNHIKNCDFHKYQNQAGRSSYNHGEEKHIPRDFQESYPRLLTTTRPGSP